jgi:hypothetical protein
MMFNVRPNTHVPGVRVSPTEDVPGFRVNTNGDPREAVSGTGHALFADYARGAKTAPLDFLSANPAHYDFIDGDAGSAVGVGAPSLVPGPGGDGSGSGWDKCTLMPGFQQFGMCLYRCPDGTIRRLDRSPLGCQPFIFRNGGLGI